MKRHGHIIEEAAELHNLEDSFDYVLRGTKRKTCPTGKKLLAHREEVVKQLREELLAGTFRIGNLRTFHIKEREKEREIQSVILLKRIALNSVMTVMERKIYRSTVADTAASIKGRGGLYLHKRLTKAMKENPDLRWFYKCDIKKFYQSIDQDVMMKIVRNTFKDKRLISILEQCVKALDKGISIGLRSSQSLANLLLSVHVDHIIKDRMEWPYFWRYCDDIVIGGESAYELTPVIEAIHEAVEAIGLTIKQTEQVFSIDKRPLDFLGYRIFGNGKTEIRKHIKKRFAKRWNRVRSWKRKQELIGSFYGVTKHGTCKNLFKRITGYNMKDFSELGLSYVSASGKKLFDCDTIQQGDLQNRQFIVKDYERDVKTKQGEGRYVVLIEMDGREFKFFTNSEELKQMLDKASEMGAVPFRTILKRKSIGGNKFKYSFT
ncbi:MAG: hypothetical protein IJ887_00430 [Prevotella sp.]|nr:hypothetical protein [Prevotella sp.]MBR3479294.1 hypothetical protein [Prevotella sp.]